MLKDNRPLVLVSIAVVLDTCGRFENGEDTSFRK
jgi:hypothetical protein